MMFANIRPLLRCYFSKVRRVNKVRYFSGSLTSFSRIYRPPEKYRKCKPVEINEPEEGDTSDDAELDVLLHRTLKVPGSCHQVFVIQPYIKWGVDKKKNTTPELQLLEAKALIKTLREWTIVHERIISLQYVRRNAVFGKGNLSQLRELIKNNSKITAVFISLNTLTLRQQTELEALFGVPVFDRYTIILNILKEHAHTKEAKLQIQLAQLPYLSSVLSGFGHGIDSKMSVSDTYFGSGLKSLSYRREIFRIREAKLKKEILELRKQRAKFRLERNKNEIPVVAVIGYTNVGKTSLVKALTGKEKLEPQDYLFATLDVTSHLGVLPSGLKVYFVDTLGFISDIPTYLMESFHATLEDAAFAEVIIHVRDISHPDTTAQYDVVNRALKDLKIPEVTLGNVITVGNKVDLVDKKDLKNYKDLICVSSTNFTGIDFLRKEIEKKILQLSDKISLTIRVQSGGPEYNWLHQCATVVYETPDEKNNQFMFLETVISSSALARFRHYFIENYER